MAEHPRCAVLRRAIEIFISPDDDAIKKLGELFTDDVTVWTPNMLALGVADLEQNLDYRESAFSKVNLQFDTLDVFGSRGLAEFRVAATFSGPFVVEEAAVIEPNGKRLLLGAAAVVDFAGNKIKAVRAYFDDASLLEQMLDA
jgi:ketosteroid isomerase-like protein